MGGFNGDYLQDVELICLNNNPDDGNCSASIADYPIYIGYPTLMCLDGKISSCGGYSRGSLDNCYDYDISNEEWRELKDLSEDRLYPSSSLVGENEWLISGGSAYGGSATTEIIRQGGVPTPGTTLPDGMFYGCQVSLNETHVFFADGYDRWAAVLDYERGTFQAQVC